MDRKLRFGLSLRLLVFLIPVIVGALVVNSVIQGMSSERGVELAMTRLLLYKSEDLMRHIENQWSLLLENGLQNDPAYTESLRRSVRTYAATMLRSDGEWIIAFDEDGVVQFSVGARVADSGIQEDFSVIEDDDVWIDEVIAGESRIGYGFFSPSLGWSIYITDIKESYYGDITLLRWNSIIMIALTTVLAAIFVILFIKRSLKPLGDIITDMHGIMVNRDFGQRVKPVQNDEIGELAREFNLMSDYLERAMSRLKSIAHMEAEARIEIRDRERETLNVLSLISDHKDPETARHTTRVGLYAALLAELRGDSREEVDLMRWAAPLHDLGKVGIPDAILMQSSSLSEDQQKIMQNHVLIGHSVLKHSKSPILRAGADIALSHHERWDGSGYPSGLKGMDITVRGRITGLADVFDALTTVRPYKEAWAFERSMDWVRGNRGILFDPEIVDLFLQASDRVQLILTENTDDSTQEARYSALT